MATDVTTPGTAGAPPAGTAPAPLHEDARNISPERRAGGTPAAPEKTLAASGIAVLFALEREAAPLRRWVRALPHVSIHVSGVGRTRARRAAEHLLCEPLPKLVIAAGFCGALAPSLRIGDIVASPRIITVDRLVTDPAEKRRLSETHDAVDMESAAIAEVCAAKGVPFLAVRAVSDAAETALSPELVQLLSGGNVSVWRAGVALVRKPALVHEFLRLARDTKRAAHTLAAALVRIVNE